MNLKVVTFKGSFILNYPCYSVGVGYCTLQSNLENARAFASLFWSWQTTAMKDEQVKLRLQIGLYFLGMEEYKVANRTNLFV